MQMASTPEIHFRYLPDTANKDIPKHVTHVIIDASVQIIDKEAFSRKRKLVQVIFDTSNLGQQHPCLLQVINYDAFANCRLLARIDLPPTVTDIRDDAFSNGKSLVHISLPHGLQWLGERTFADCTALKFIQIPSTVEELGFRLFCNCRSLVSVELMDGLLVIGEKIFEHCTSLRNVSIPSTVEVVEPNAFLNCLKLEQRFPYTAELHHALEHRFEELPMHRMCYQNAFSHSDGMEYVDGNELSMTGASRDCLEMTVLHLLALSTTPNLSLWKDILAKLPQPSQLAQTKDRWNQSPYDYLMLHLETSHSETQEDSAWKLMMEHMIEVTLIQPTQSLGLERWRRDVLNRVDLFQTNALTADQIHDAYDKLSVYMKLEVYSIVELAIWKAKMDSEQRTGNKKMDRKGCQFQCGVQVILPNVMTFLKDCDWLV